jgi:uncharacterized transporter YbjL
VGLILVIGLMPKLFNINLAKEAIKLKKEDDASRKQPALSQSDILVRAFRLENKKVIGLSLREINEKSEIQFTVQKIKRNGELFHPILNTILEEGDGLFLIGFFDPKVLENISSDVIGPHIRDRELLHYTPDSVKICITHKLSTGTKLGGTLNSIIT